jgi:hypothetical protein
MQSQHRSTHLLRVMHGDAAVHTLVDAIVCQSGAATALETRRVASIMGVQEPGRRSGWRCWLPCCQLSRASWRIDVCRCRYLATRLNFSSIAAAAGCGCYPTGTPPQITIVRIWTCLPS